MDKIALLSPSTLAFVGDAVYSLLVRTALARVNRPSAKLHRLSVAWVKASAQARAMAVLEPHLTGEEKEIFKRGRNYHTASAPKSATRADYHAATGLETLFGYLYLTGNRERIEHLFSFIENAFCENEQE